MGVPGSLFSFIRCRTVHGDFMTADVKYRLGGLLCLIAFVGIGWWGIWQPLHAAQAHAAEVRYSLKIFVLVPALLVFGLFFLIGGARWSYRDANKKLTAVGWGLMAVVVVISGLSFWWLQHVFSALGYTSG